MIVLITGGIYWGLKDDLPQLPDNLESINLSLPTEIYSADGQLIRVLGERHPVTLAEVSPYFQSAIIATEDSRFYRHSGLDHISLLRALYVNFKSGRIAQGGSTLTQQLSKNLFFSFERNWIRKIKELLIALQMESTFTKDQILEAYCNQVYFGHGAYGVEEASEVYFGKQAKDLTLLQAATLAGVPSSPNEINPFANVERSQSRTRYVLNRMKKEHYISQEQMEMALTSNLELATPKKVSDPNLYFVNYVMDQLEREYSKEFVYFGGLKIFTTLDSRFQQYAQKAVQLHLGQLDRRMEKRAKSDPLQSALVAIENKTGAVRAMIGGRDYSHSQFNRAVSDNRLPGSSFKPFVYFTAMEELGLTPATVVRDEPIVFEIPGTDPWEPKNFGEEFYGDLILKKALMNSINIISAKLVSQVTPQKVIETARKFGITSPLGNHFSLALGTSPVSPLEMAAAYSVIGNLGVYNQPYFIQRIEDFNGKRLIDHFHRGVRRFSRKSIYPLSDMMQGVIDDGTGRVVRKMGFKHPAAGKTGTTNDFKDAWFIGFTKDISTAVWVGYDDNETMKYRSGRGLTGAGAAAPIWVFFMKKALEGKNEVQFPVPFGIRKETVDIRTGYYPEMTALEVLEVALKEEAVLKPYQPDSDNTMIPKDNGFLIPSTNLPDNVPNP